MYAAQYVHVRAVRAEGDEMGFDSVGVDASFASALSGVLDAEVPGMAIECAFTKDNTSVYVRTYCMLPEPQTLSSVKCLCNPKSHTRLLTSTPLEKDRASASEAAAGRALYA